MNNTVSIITAAYNSEKFISQTINSVLDQTYADWEMIIIDDASTDNTRSIINDFQKKDKRIKAIFLSENVGAGKARNEGIKVANGRFMAFLDSDDTWLKDKLNIQVNFMLQNSYVFTYTSYSAYDEFGVSLNKTITAPKSCNYKRLLKQNCIGCSTVIIDISSLGKEYMPSLRSRQDWALWLKYLKKFDVANYLNKSLTRYTVRKGSVSSRKVSLIKYHWLIYKKVLKYNMVKSSILLMINLITLTIIQLKLIRY